ncbi:MAG: hypothetical protein AAFY28_04700 [Actinomycetota bacterium]
MNRTDRLYALVEELRGAAPDAVNGPFCCAASAVAIAATSPAEKFSGGSVCAVSSAYPPRRPVTA